MAEHWDGRFKVNIKEHRSSLFLVCFGCEGDWLRSLEKEPWPFQKPSYCALSSNCYAKCHSGGMIFSPFWVQAYRLPFLSKLRSLAKMVTSTFFTHTVLNQSCSFATSTANFLSVSQSSFVLIDPLFPSTTTPMVMATISVSIVDIFDVFIPDIGDNTLNSPFKSSSSHHHATYLQILLQVHLLSLPQLIWPSLLMRVTSLLTLSIVSTSHGPGLSFTVVVNHDKENVHPKEAT
uniref:Uncharacterized protein n=1 Tax=Cannabis sativa TaxID=3483 RepID=A0A803PJU2_CANSA